MKVLEVAEVSPVLVAIRREAVPAVPVISHPAKVATPDTAVTGLVVQFSVPVPEAMDRVTDADEPVTMAPLAFSTLHHRLGAERHAVGSWYPAWC